MAHFVDLYSRRMGKQIDEIPSETLSALSSYEWPEISASYRNMKLNVPILPNEDGVLPNPLPKAEAQDAIMPNTVTLRDSERTLILNALESVRWVIGGRKGAAAKLGLKRTTLIHKMQNWGSPVSLSRAANIRLWRTQVSNGSRRQRVSEYKMVDSVERDSFLDAVSLRFDRLNFLTGRGRNPLPIGLAVNVTGAKRACGHD